MYISYFDETGDDGYPQYSSKLFVLTSLYLHHQQWKETYQKIQAFRRELRDTYSFPVKVEFHTKQFLLNKKPYRQFGFSEDIRLKIVKEFSDFLATLSDSIEIINVGIDKTRIQPHNPGKYANVLDTALNYNVQRIENTIKRTDSETKFLIITDEGRVGKMRQTTRKIQKINFVPSQFGNGTYRNEIQLLIEDPLPKNSSESYFIQICDFVSFFVYLYLLKKNEIDDWHGRLGWLQFEDVVEILEKMIPCLNTQESRQDPFGLVVYPK